MQTNGKKEDKNVCKFFIRGHCQFGEKCKHLHPANYQKPQTQKVQQQMVQNSQESEANTKPVFNYY